MWTWQQNNSLSSPGNRLPANWATSNGTNTLILASPTGNLFFRLSNP